MREHIAPWALLAFAPFLIAYAYLQLPFVRTAGSDFVMEGVAVSVGWLGIWIAPWSKRAKVIATFVYIPIMFVAVAVFVIMVLCSAGDCL